MKSLIQHIMDISTYRKYIVNFHWFNNNHLTDEPWEQVRVFVSPHLRLIQSDKLIGAYNHPLVNSGEAYWSNNATLCIGYRLRNNPDIFRPIFNQNRQHNINQFQNNIKRVVEKRKEKRAFIELFKIKLFPRVLVEKIIKLAY